MRVIESLESRVLLDATLLRDINTGTQSAFPSQGVVFGDTLLFQATDATHGAELWRSDGTAAGTWMVKDLVPGSVGGLPRSLTVAGPDVYFFANAQNGALQLWKTDGTDPGTVLVKQIRADSSFPYPSAVYAGGHLFFCTASGAGKADALWVSDGTANGTYELTSDTSGAAGSSASGLVAEGNLAFFSADNGGGRLSVWKSDGSAAGTVMLHDLGNTPVSTGYGALTAAGGFVFFIYNAPGGNAVAPVLWRTDGTPAGTISLDSFYSVGELCAVGSRLFFAGNDTTHGLELWVSDGTVSGTSLVSDIYPGPSQSLPHGLTAVGDTAFFVADDPSHGYELWKSDGTTAGTVAVKDVSGTGSDTYSNLAGVGDRLYFNARSQTGGYDLWESDGTDAETQILHPGLQGEGFVPVNGKVLFTATDPDTGAELWSTSGVPGDAALVTDINTAPAPSDPVNFVGAGGTLYFTAADQRGVAKLYKTDGTPSGTQLVSDAVGVANPWQPMIDFNGSVYFAGNDATHGTELWKSDGTAQGTALVKDILPGPNSSSPQSFVNLNGVLYFSTPGSVYRTDGTAGGTQLVAPNPSRAAARLFGAGGRLLIDGGGSLYALNDAGSSFVALCPGGTSGSGADIYSNDVAMDGSLYVLSQNNPAMLYRSDGTAAGTVLLKNFGPGSSLGERGRGFMTSLNHQVYFVVSTAAAGAELWRTDGTAAGTVMVRDVNPGTTGSAPMDLTILGGNLYFSADDGTSGRELWVSDGTAPGTHEVADINPGSQPALAARFYPQLVRNIVSGGGVLFFSATDGTHGTQIWESDGTALGTVPLQDLYQAPGWPLSLTFDNGTLYFATDDGIHSTEPWALNVGGTIVGSVMAPSAGAPSPAPIGLAGAVVFLDANGNGVLDTGEPSATTDATGKYAFVNLLPGDYVVRQLPPAGYRRTAPLAAATTVSAVGAQITAGPLFQDVLVSSVPMDFGYLLTLAQHYGQPGTFATGDANDDGTVNFADLLLVAQNYGHPLPAATLEIEPASLRRPTLFAKVRHVLT